LISGRRVKAAGAVDRPAPVTAASPEGEPPAW